MLNEKNMNHSVNVGAAKLLDVVLSLDKYTYINPPTRRRLAGNVASKQCLSASMFVGHLTFNIN